MRIISWFPWSPYSRWRAKREGRADDAVNNDPVHYENRLIDVGESEANRIAQEWENLDKKLKGKYCTAKARYISAEKELVIAQKMVEEASKEYEAARKNLGEFHGHHHMNILAYGFLLAFLALTELPLNAIAFRTAGEPELMTYIMVLALAASLPMSAHFLGVLLRHERFSKREYILMSSAFLIPIVVIAGIAYFRDKYIGEAGKILGVEMDALTVALIFVAINLLIFLVGLLASYFAHDPDIIKCQRLLREAGKRLKRSEKRLNKVQCTLSRAKQTYTRIAAIRENTFDEKKKKVAEVNDGIQELVSIYRQHYGRAAKQAKLNVTFGQKPEIEIPDTFHNLDWNCPELTEETKSG